jgi:hypothetical protein
LSLVKILTVEPGLLRVSGIDCVDGTPVYDVKPYLPWCEAPGDARADWAGLPPARCEETAVLIAPVFADQLGVDATRLVRDVLRLEIVPAYQDAPARVYGVSLAGWNIRWRQTADGMREVCAVQRL